MSDKMADITSSRGIPVPEKTLRDLSRDLAKVVPKFGETESATGVKQLHEIIEPILDTADQSDLSSSHRAAATNALCGVIEQCQASSIQYVRDAILDDSIWIRLLDIFLQRSDNAKGKSMRQMLLVLTGLLTKNPSPRSSELRDRATTIFLDIICQRQDRVKVKPALQGLAHFLQKDVVSNDDLIQLYSKLLEHSSAKQYKRASPQTLLYAFLAWIVHHDTALSAGHLLKNFLSQLRQQPDSEFSKRNCSEPVWIEPVIQTLHHWPERIQEFKTHVFPHCFLPNIHEYIKFLSYLHFSRHVDFEGNLPQQILAFDDRKSKLDDFEEFRILLATIQTGKELGIVRDTDFRLCSTVQIDELAVHLPDDIFGGWLAHPEPEVRLAGLFLSVHSTAVTRPITGGVFKSLRRNLIHLHTDTDANFRRELLGYLQKLFDRLRGSTATFVKGKGKAASQIQDRLPFPKECFGRQKSSLQDPLLEPLSFIVWYTHFLEWELRLTATYQRRVTALRALTVVLRSGLDPRVPHAQLSKSAQGQLHWAHGLHVATPRIITTLLDLILDPFDDIRDSSVSALQLCLESLSSADREATLATLPRFLSRAEATMLRTGRADQADGVARAYSLLFSLTGGESEKGLEASAFGSTRYEILARLNEQLKETLIVARDNLSEAVNGQPIHGTFASLRYIIDQEGFYDQITALPTQEFAKWKNVHDNLLTNYEALWEYIQHVLCADAPEGHVPEELEEETNLDTKEILSYSWRGLKEASILLRTAISKAPIGDDDCAMISPECFEKLGRLCFTQLVELRHRGAFSTVAQTFAAFCRRCLSTENDLLQSLPEKWYKETLTSIRDKAASITRRSAGIPSLMAGIIAADPQPGSQLFSRAMKDLIAEASLAAQSSNIEESRLPQVHALNCIKEIFTTSRLSIASEAYIGEGLELAARTLNSKIWPIRNCGLMLFKALIERLLGSDEAQDWKERERAKTSRFSYNNYPSLVGILSDLLDPNGPLKRSMNGTPESSSPLDLHGAEGVFPALQILRQARPPEIHLDGILSSVQKLLASPHWHLRDMAARTIVSLRSLHELYDASMVALTHLDGSHNAQHGTLMAVEYMLRKLMHDPSNLDSQRFEALIHKLSTISTPWYCNNICPFTTSAFLDIVALCGMSLLRRQENPSTIDAWSKLVSTLSIGPDQGIALPVGVGHALLRASFAQVFIIDRLILRPNCLGAITSPNYQTVGDALILLAADDADTCISVLEVLDNAIQVPSRKGPALPLSLITAHIFRLPLHISDPEVISKAQAVLANALMNKYLHEPFFRLVIKSDVMDTLKNLEVQCLQGSPSNMQSALHLMGFFLDFVYSQYPDQRRILLGMVAKYIRILRMTIIDTNPFDARFAAVQSISALEILWTASTTSKATGTLILGLSFVLYDMLNDDDDEVREGAALATAKLLRAQHVPHAKDSVPILTSNRLAIFLINTFPNSKDLSREALRRLLNTHHRSRLLSTPFSNILATERQEDTALFATEKQNLFKDDTLDVIVWTRVLSSLHPSVVPMDTRLALMKWVLDALATLTTTAENEVDGALGWTSKSEVFTLGIRVICAAEVALKWGDGTTEGKTRLLKALCELRNVGIKGEIHGLWIERLDKVLDQEVLVSLRKAKMTLLALK